MLVQERRDDERNAYGERDGEQEERVVFDHSPEGRVAQGIDVGAGPDPGRGDPVPVGHRVVDGLSDRDHEQGQDHDDGRDRHQDAGAVFAADQGVGASAPARSVRLPRSCVRLRSTLSRYRLVRLQRTVRRDGLTCGRRDGPYSVREEDNLTGRCCLDDWPAAVAGRSASLAGPAWGRWSRSGRKAVPCCRRSRSSGWITLSIIG